MRVGVNSCSMIVSKTMALESWILNADIFGADDSKNANSTVVEIAVSNPDFSILVEAVTKAGLGEALSADGPFTVFAPTNDAFESLFSQLGIAGVKDLTEEQLTPILAYHVVSGKVMSTDLWNTSVAKTYKLPVYKTSLTNSLKILKTTVLPDLFLNFSL